jgi:tRNA threonylcarbamoyladenosine biosynthesis protein TsaB
MKILAFDTTHGDCSVALYSDGAIVAEITEAEEGKQAERLLSIIAEVMAKANVTYDDLAAVAVNVGTGSFTGVRIGIAAAQGLNLVKKMPLIAATSFESGAYGIDKNVLVVLDAKRGQVYAQMFGAKPNEPQMLDYADISAAVTGNDFVLTGNGSALVSDILTEKGHKFSMQNIEAVSCAKNIAYVAANKYLKMEYSSDISPLYIRLPDAKIETPKQK